MLVPYGAIGTMKEFSLEILYSIIGVGAASGLFYKDNTIYLISDDSNYLYKYEIPTGTLGKILLNGDRNINEQLPKKNKRDLEAIAFDASNLYIYGSGSTSSGRRDSRITIAIDNDQSHVESLTPLFRRLQEKFDVAIDNFNIEGAIHHAGDVYLFNRGNGPEGQNGIFKLATGDSTFIPITLPSSSDMKFGFTDAILVGDAIYFVATAEDSDSVYEDGTIQGSMLGKLSFPSLELESYITISETHKFEGITLYTEDAQKITFLLCEDRDNDVMESAIYQLTLLK